MIDTSIFSQRILEVRKKTNLSQRELGDAAAVSAQAVSAYERGLQLPTLSAAADIAQALGVSLDYLVGLSDDPKAPVAPRSDLPLSTVADVVDALATLRRSLPGPCGTQEISIPEEDCYDPDDTTYTAAAFFFNCPALAGFVQAWNKMAQLYSNGILSREILESWYAGELDRLSKIHLEDHYRTPVLFGLDQCKKEE